MQNFDREYVLALLKEEICYVTFEKVDGTKRSMRATLQDRLIPQTKNMNATIARAYPADVIRCYDLDKKEWRSFKMDRLLDIQIELEPTFETITIEEYNEMYASPLVDELPPVIIGLTPAPLPDTMPTDNNPVSFEPEPPSFSSNDDVGLGDGFSAWDDD